MLGERDDFRGSRAQASAAHRETDPEPRPAPWARSSSIGRDADLRHLGILVLWTVGIVAGEATTWLLLRSQGVDVSGDAANYLVQSQTLAHLHLNPVPFYLHDFAIQYLYKWGPHPTLSLGQVVAGPHGHVFEHNIGLPAVLAPFMRVGSAPLALLGFFALNAIGIVYLHQRVAKLANLRRAAQLAFALILAAPAIWLAGTQVYPDLITGIVLACVLCEIAWVEADGRLTLRPALVIGAGLAVVPWLQVKNLVPAAAVVIALGAIGIRRRLKPAAVAGVIAAPVCSLVALGVYNQYYFGDLLGLHEPSERLDAKTITQIAALVFDRHHGIAVQAPVVLVGLLGLCYAFRRLPLSVIASLVAAGSIVIINGAYPAMGAESFAGRFQWTVLPIVLAWSSFYLRRPSRARLVGISTAVGALWLWQAVPIVLGAHSYVNASVAPFSPWDPSTYPGWWPGINGALPAMLANNTHLADYASRLALELVLLAGGAALLHRLTKPKPFGARAGIVFVASTSVAAALATAPGSALPPPLTWAGAGLGAPWTAAANAQSQPPTPLNVAGAGSYLLTITYQATGSAPARVSVLAGPSDRKVVHGWFTPAHPTDAVVLSVSPAPIPADAQTVATEQVRPRAGSSTATMTFGLTGTALLGLRVTAPAGDAFAIRSMHLTKRSD